MVLGFSPAVDQVQAGLLRIHDWAEICLPLGMCKQSNTQTNLTLSVTSPLHFTLRRSFTELSEPLRISGAKGRLL